MPNDTPAFPITDTDRINWIINNSADIDAPQSPYESTTWVIYIPSNQLGSGVGCHKDLRKAIDMAMIAAREGKK